MKGEVKEVPKKEAPMEVNAPGAVVTTQPTAEPKPEASRLRGGGMSLGFDCCGGACHFRKHCC